MKVLVLMASFNGEPWIREQINSLLSQDLPGVGVLVRDDGSSDLTTDILEEYQRQGSLHWYTGAHLGASRSFWDLLKNSTDAEYYAFCDQDDVWDPDKLETAVHMLEQHNDSVPLLYCSDVRVVDKELKLVSRTLVKAEGTDPAHAAVRNIAPGCTFVFNRSARDLLCEYDDGTFGLDLHDWTVYQIISCSGTVIFDPLPHLSYRQHGGNAIGAHPRNMITLLKKIPDFWNGPLTNSRTRRAERLLQAYGDRISPEAYRLLSMITHYREDHRIKRDLLQYLRRHLSHKEYLPVSTLIRLNRF